MADCPVVKTSLGKVKGRCCTKAKRPHAKPVYRYSSIPFAKPPLDDLRFEPPQSPKPWKDVKDCTKMAKTPMQSLAMSAPFEHLMPFTNEFGENWMDFGEDCLYLNVYTSKPQSSAKMPVLVWFYGGAFSMGGSACYDGTVLASLHDVVVVIPNYRVNCLGFLSFSGDKSPLTGNVGMLDQIKSLQWIKDNIKAFGGDPGNVTIFGESAGAISVSMHLVSPLSKGLFHKAISHSGVSSIEMMVSEDNKQSVEELLSELEITEKDPKKIIKLLRKLPAKKLVEAQDKSFGKMSFVGPIKKDGVFLPKKPDDVLKAGAFHKVPYILGVNSTECSGMSAPAKEKGFDKGLSEKDAREALQGVFSFIAPPDKVPKVLDEVFAAYGKDLDMSDKFYWSKIAASCFCDMWFVVGSKTMAQIHSGKAPTFFYQMSMQPRFHHDRAFNSNDKSEMKPEICECDHGDDILYTFGMPLSNAPFTFDIRFSEEEEKMSEMWMAYLVNFANTGNPNKGPHKVPVEWTAYDGKEDNFINAHTNFGMKKGLNVNGVKFWTETFPSLLA